MTATNIVRIGHAAPDNDRLNDEVAAIVKGMLLRGDKQSDIAACFLINGGRISEINTGKRFGDVVPAPEPLLPPPGPYPSFFDIWKHKRGAWRARVALENVADLIQQAIVAIHKIEQQ